MDREILYYTEPDNKADIAMTVPKGTVVDLNEKMDSMSAYRLYSWPTNDPEWRYAIPLTQIRVENDMEGYKPAAPIYEGKGAYVRTEDLSHLIECCYKAYG